MFISIDGVGTGEAIVNGAVGSERHRVTFTGPGGHSYGSFGIVNPAYALAAAIQKVSAFPASLNPRTTFNVGRIGGGTSVNSVPSDVWMEVDLRSESAEELEALSRRFRKAVEEAATEENRTRSTAQGPVRVDIEVLGVRPAGTTPAGSSLVEIAAATTRAMGGTPRFVSSSTDANLPISLGVPAISIDTGMTGGRAHAPDEWIDVAPATNIKGQERALLLVMSLAGLR
jgi:di/tripeptidase